MKNEILIAAVLSLLGAGCASEWKVQGGPAACEKMCANWGLDFTAMVGVGNQDKSGPGATACVCQPKQDKRSASIKGASGSSTGLAAPVVAAEQAAAAAQAANAAAAAQTAQMMSTRNQQSPYTHH